MKLRWREPTIALVFLIPAFVGVIIFMYYPLIQTAIYSVHSLHRTADWLNQPFVGLKNYLAVAQSSSFWSTFRYTLYFTFLSVSLELCIGLGMAMATFRVSRILGGVMRALIVIPWVIPPVITAMIWKFLFQSDVGAISYLFRASGLVDAPPQFLTDPFLARHTPIVAHVWKNSSIVAIMLMGGLAAIPKDIYDAAKADGARAWFRFWHITLPMLLPAMLVVLLFMTANALRTFDIIYGLTGGGPGNTTEVLSTFAYKYYFTYGRFGVGSAYAMVIFAIVAGVAIWYVSRIRGNLRFKG